MINHFLETKGRESQTCLNFSIQAKIKGRLNLISGVPDPLAEAGIPLI